VILTEAEEPKNMVEDEHHLLQVSFPGEPEVIVDLSYGQIEHQTPMLVTPLAEIEQRYPGLTELKDRV